MTGVTVAGIGAALVFIALAWVAVLAAQPAARRIQAASSTREMARRLSAGKDWLTRLVTAQILVLAAGAAVVIALGSVFAEVTEAVMDEDDLTAVDRPLLAWLSTHRTTPLTEVQIGITNLGGGPVLIGALAIAAIGAAAKLRSWHPLVLAIVAGGGIQLLVYTMKLLIGRLRPEPAGRLVDVGGFSFPSGHSASAAACFGILAWLVCLVTRNAQTRATAWVAAGLFTFAVGLSRAYLGVHYPSDIIGGWVLGATWLITIAIAAYAVRHAILPRRKSRRLDLSGTPSQ